MDKEIDTLLPPKYRDKPADYWANRQAKLTKLNAKQTEKQLQKYYRKALDDIMQEYEFVYMKLLTTQEGIKPTPADLYKLDKYWTMQGEVTKRLTRLGDKQASFFREMFVRHYRDIYNSIDINPAHTSFFKNMDSKAIEQIINQIWCADGDSWSNRIWKNTEKLKQALNEGLVTCVATGATTEDLKRQLTLDFDVSYNRAKSIVNTEMAHIQTQAAADRYKDAGIKEFEVWADEDERRCEVCGKLHEKRYLIGELPPIPAHPNCRCCIVPVVE